MNTLIEFRDIREFAIIHFYAWEHGEDFDWLKKEWPKFKTHIKELAEAEDFILTLAFIYSTFCHESYFLKRSEGIMTPHVYVNEQ